MTPVAAAATDVCTEEMLDSATFGVSALFTGSCTFGGDAVQPFAPFKISAELGNRCVEEEEMK